MVIMLENGIQRRVLIACEIHVSHLITYCSASVPVPVLGCNSRLCVHVADTTLDWGNRDCWSINPSRINTRRLRAKQRRNVYVAYPDINLWTYGCMSTTWEHKKNKSHPVKFKSRYFIARHHPMQAERDIVLPVPPVCLSVRPLPVLCQNGLVYTTSVMLSK